MGVCVHAQSSRRCPSGYINTAKSRPPNQQLTLPPSSFLPPPTTELSPPGRRSASFAAPRRAPEPARSPLLLPRRRGAAAGDRSIGRREQRAALSCGADDEGRVDGGDAGDGPLRLVPGRRRGLVRGAAAAGLDGAREQGVRAGAGRAGPALPGLGAGGARHGEDRPRGGHPLQGPRGRRAPDRVRPRALPRLRPRRGRRGGVHPAVGRRARRGGRGLPARLPVRRRRREAARRRPHARAGAEEGRAVDRGGAQVVPARPEEVRQRGLEEHLAQLRADQDADAGGQPRAEVLHQAQLGGRQGQAQVQHPRHHHRAPQRRPAPLAIIPDQPVQRTDSELSSDRAECGIQLAEPDARDAELRHGVARSVSAVWSSA